jgi:hypothetical protein
MFDKADAIANAKSQNSRSKSLSKSRLDETRVAVDKRRSLRGSKGYKGLRDGGAGARRLL